MSKFGFAIIGCGYMGSNHARVVSGSARAQLEVMIDTDLDLAQRRAARFGAKASADAAAAFNCDAAVVATPTQSHVEIALQLVEAGLPVMVEKPIATRIEDVEALCNAAVERGAMLMCGFVERFNPVVIATQDLLEEPPLHIVGLRHSPAAPRIESGVVHDLLIHDLDLVLRLAQGPVERVVGTAWTPPGSELAEIADCTLKFANGGIATLSASRAAQRKVRWIQIGTRSTFYELDLLRHDITVYRHVRQEQDANTLSYRAETVIDIPFIRHRGEPLALQLEHFLDLIDGETGSASEVDQMLATHRVADQVARQCSSERGPAGAGPR